MNVIQEAINYLVINKQKYYRNSKLNKVFLITPNNVETEEIYKYIVDTLNMGKIPYVATKSIIKIPFLGSIFFINDSESKTVIGYAKTFNIPVLYLDEQNTELKEIENESKCNM